MDGGRGRGLGVKLLLEGFDLEVSAAEFGKGLGGHVSLISNVVRVCWLTGFPAVERML